jgi:hypothetical protein
MSLQERIDAVIESLKAERELAPSVRTSRADDDQLDFAIELMMGIQKRLAASEPPSGLFSYPNLARMVTDSWNLLSPLSGELVELERLYLRGKLSHS